MVSSGDFRKPYRRRKSSPCRSDNVTASPPRGPSTRLYHRDAGARAVRGSLETRERGASERAPRRRRRAPTGSVFATDEEMLGSLPAAGHRVQVVQRPGAHLPLRGQRARAPVPRADRRLPRLARGDERAVALIGAPGPREVRLGHREAGQVPRDALRRGQRDLRRSAEREAHHRRRRRPHEAERDRGGEALGGDARARRRARNHRHSSTRDDARVERRDRSSARRSRSAATRRVRPRRPGNRAGGRRARAAPTSTSTSPTSPRSRTRPWRASSRSSACRRGPRTRPSRRASSGPCTR